MPMLSPPNMAKSLAWKLQLNHGHGMLSAVACTGYLHASVQCMGAQQHGIVGSRIAQQCTEQCFLDQAEQ